MTDGWCTLQNKLINWKQWLDESVTDLYKHIMLDYFFSVIFNLLLSHFIIFLRHAIKSILWLIGITISNTQLINQKLLSMGYNIYGFFHWPEVLPKRALLSLLSTCLPFLYHFMEQEIPFLLPIGSGLASFKKYILFISDCHHLVWTRA